MGELIPAGWKVSRGASSVVKTLKLPETIKEIFQVETKLNDTDLKLIFFILRSECQSEIRKYSNIIISDIRKSKKVRSAMPMGRYEKIICFKGGCLFVLQMFDIFYTTSYIFLIVSGITQSKYIC